jgi:uncharacterized protein YxeA
MLVIIIITIIIAVMVLIIIIAILFFVIIITGTKNAMYVTHRGSFWPEINNPKNVTEATHATRANRGT